MRYTIICLSLSFVLFAESSQLYGQVNFSVPAESIADYSGYDRIETCNALLKRMQSQLSYRLDSVAYKSRIYSSERVDTTPDIIKRSVGSCVDKFGLDVISRHDSVTRGTSIVGEALIAYYSGGKYDRFWSLVDSAVDGVKADSGYLDYMDKINYAVGAVSSVKPVNHVFIDSIHNKYLIPRLLEYKEDLRAYSLYSRILFSRIDRIYKDSIDKGLSHYKTFVEHIESGAPNLMAEDQPGGANQLRHWLRIAYDRIHHYNALESLKYNGPDGYFSVLNGNHKRAGYISAYRDDFMAGENRIMFLPLAFIAYKNGGGVWKSEMEGEVILNSEYPLFDSKLPKLVLALDHICKREFGSKAHRATSGGVSNECWAGIEYLKWFIKTYPEIEVTVITATDGHYSDLAIKNPYKEAELIRDFFWKTHQLSVNVVIYCRGSFRLTGLDQRREDLPNENKSKYAELINYKQTPFMPPTLVGGDGRIIKAFMPRTILAATYNLVRNTEEFMKPFMEWYRRSGYKHASEN